MQVFNEAIAAALLYKERPPEDFMEDVLRTIDYFDKKVGAAHRSTLETQT